MNHKKVSNIDLIKSDMTKTIKYLWKMDVTEPVKTFTNEMPYQCYK